MFKSLKTNFLLLFCFFTLSSIAFAQTPEMIDCDPENRPDPNDCIEQDEEDTCAYYQDCPFEVCGITVNNGCYACSDPNVVSYTRETCPDNAEPVIPCNPDLVCTVEQNAQNNLAYSPVCGVGKSESGEFESRTFDNECAFCRDGSYRYFQYGTCENDKNYCPGFGPENNENNENQQQQQQQQDSEVDFSVCAYFDAIYTTVASGEEACSEPTVQFWSAGACGEPPLNNQTYCLPSVRPEACTADENPVCGFYYNENNVLSFKVMPNACSACADPDILYHTPGACIFYCDFNSNMENECVGGIHPVCGRYEEGGEERKISVRNECIACYSSDQPITSYSQGLCEGDRGIRCENDSSAMHESSDPVCAYSTEDCDDDSCRKTFSGPEDACADESWGTIWYSAGACPGDEEGNSL